jgi:hypothetical protein
VKLPARQLGGLEDATLNFEALEGRWGQLENFAGVLSVRVFGGAGVPAASGGLNGDLFVRKDGGAMTTVYQKRAGVWTAIL